MAHALLDREIRITGYRPELAMQIISWLARHFLDKWGEDTEMRHRMTLEVQNFLVKIDNPRNTIMCAWDDENLVGAVAIEAAQMEQGSGGNVRWFIVDEKYRGQGFGRFLFEKALEHCQAAGYDTVALTTFKGIDPAIPLYYQAGFKLKQERDVSSARSKLVELYFEKEI